MAEARYRLVWPKDLFIWEGRRVAALPNDVSADATELLLSEAFEDPAVVTAYRNETGLYLAPWTPPGVQEVARAWMTELIADSTRLMPYVPPRYYAERKGHTSAPSNPYQGLGVEFATILVEMQEHGYFPNALPRYCVDAPTDWDEVGERVRRAIHVPFSWNGAPVDGGTWDQPLLFSLMEYFHDQAARPRTVAYVHDYGGCGPHYANHSAESGGAVYRWRVNELLDRHRVGLNLGKIGDERGRLVRRFGTPVDDTADKRVAEGADAPEDEVAHAIRMFRMRGASATEKRAALALLAGALEARRQNAKVVLGDDERDLFNIANNFGLRHRNNRQRMHYGEEFLDYMFSAYVSAVTLLEALERRSDGGAA